MIERSRAMRDNYIHLIDQTGLDALKGLIGESMMMLYSASLHVTVVDGRPHVKAYDVSIGSATGPWVIIQNDWEGYIEWIDCFAMSVTTAQDPHNLKISRSGHKVTIEGPWAEVQLWGGRLTSLDVFEHREIANGHEVLYDCALVFTFQNGRRFALEREDSIVGLMQLRFGADEVNDIERTYSRRVHLSHTV